MWVSGGVVEVALWFGGVLTGFRSASEFRHPSEVRHLHFIAILKSFTMNFRHTCILCC